MVLTSVCVLLAVGTRSTVSKLEKALHRLRLEMGATRRRNRQVEAVEAVGRALAARGPEPDTLEQVMDLLHDNLGYSHVSIYLVDGDKLRLGAQRGYERPDRDVRRDHRGDRPDHPQPPRGAGRPTLARDPDYLDVAGDVTSEVCAPLVVDGELLGVVNIESNRSALDESDLNLVLLVADRLASALALARERRSLAERADLFQRLTAFGNSITGSLDAEILYPTIVDGVRRVLHSDIVVLTVLDRATGRYLIRAMSGGDTSFVGTEIRPGEGVSGRAIRDRTVVVDERLGRDRFPQDVQAAKVPDVLTAIGLPLVRDGAVVGALAVTRTDLDLPFSRVEREVSGVLGSQIALALTNTFLHSDVTEASVRDPLTGLFNRRHLDASIDRFLAARRRQAPEQRAAGDGDPVRPRPLRGVQQAPRAPGRRRGPARLRRAAPRALPGERPGRPLRRRGVRGGPRRRDARRRGPDRQRGPPGLGVADVHRGRRRAAPRDGLRRLRPARGRRDGRRASCSRRPTSGWRWPRRPVGTSSSRPEPVGDDQAGVGAGRQPDDEARPATGPLGRGDRAAVLVDDPGPDRQAEPGPARAGVRRAPEPVEDVLAVLRRDARAVVVDGQDRLASLAAGR